MLCLVLIIWSISGLITAEEVTVLEGQTLSLKCEGRISIEEAAYGQPGTGCDADGETQIMQQLCNNKQVGAYLFCN